MPRTKLCVLPQSGACSTSISPCPLRKTSLILDFNQRILGEPTKKAATKENLPKAQIQKMSYHNLEIRMAAGYTCHNYFVNLLHRCPSATRTPATLLFSLRCLSGRTRSAPGRGCLRCHFASAFRPTQAELSQAVGSTTLHAKAWSARSSSARLQQSQCSHMQARAQKQRKKYRTC